MNTLAPASSPSSPPAPPARRPWWEFTHPGCRTELRLGALLVLAGTFLWNFAGPGLALRIAIMGLPLLAIGAVLQALIEARRGIDAFPGKLALAMLALGLPMCWDFRFRDGPGEPLQLLLLGPILAGSGGWLLVWWGVDAWLRRRVRTS